MLGLALSSVLVMSLAGCAEPDVDGDPSEQAPAPIGDELMHIEGAWSDCSGGAHLYRDGAHLQSQCFRSDGSFAFENHGTLTASASETLDTLLAEADPDDTEPVNHRGLCGAPDAMGLVTMWVGGQTVSFEIYCVAEGVLAVYEYVEAVWSELSSCGEGFPELLESIESGCRQY